MTLEKNIIYVIMILTAFAGYCAGRASIHKDVIEVEAGR